MSASEQALYQELIDICNEENWCTSFQVSNGELLNNLQCTEVSLRTWRTSLINAGLIKYNSGKSKRAFGSYSMVLKNNTNPLPNTLPDSAPNTIPNPEDYIKLNKTEPNKSLSISDKSPPKKTFKNFTEEEFKEEIRIYKNDFDSGLLNKFYEYWKEKSAGGKMKFQLEKTWETKLRLARWKANSAKFQNSKYNNEKNRTGAGVSVSGSENYSERL